jgi:4-hydroxybenzoate polyprenyltransferase
VSHLRTFWRFLSQRFPVLRYLVYVAVWSTGIVSALAPLRTPRHLALPDAGSLVCGVLTVFAVLFFMRVVDEVKDLDYDRVYKRDRPLVTGEVTRNAVLTYLISSAVAALALSAVIGLVPMTIAASVMVYSLFLLWLERTSRRFADSMFGNIAVTIQLKTLLVCFVAALSWYEAGPIPVLPTASVVLAFVAAYLHWEISRKTVRDRFAIPGEKLYSAEIGAWRSLAVAGVLLVVACALEVSVAAYWERPVPFQIIVLLVPLLGVFWSAIRFATKSSMRYAPATPSLIAYWSFLVAPIAGSFAVTL